MTGAWSRAVSPQATWRWYRAALTGMTLWLGWASSPSPSGLVAYEVPHVQKTGLPEGGISAHRGGQLGCPVNSIGAFQRAICRGVDFVLVDHAEEAMGAAYALGSPPVVVRGKGSPPFTCPGPPCCDGAHSFY